MRIFLTFCLTFTLVAICSAAALAQSAPRPARPAPTPTPKTIRGEIAHVDIENSTFTVLVTVRQQTQEVPFDTDAQTQILLDGEPATVVDLRRWMRVTVTPDSGTATRVVARSLTAAELKKRKEVERGK